MSNILTNLEVESYRLGYKAGERIASHVYHSINTTYRAARCAATRAKHLDLTWSEATAFIQGWTDANAGDSKRFERLERALTIARADYQTVTAIVRSNG